MKIRNLKFQYDKKLILDEISFTIPKGKITTILGPNGCGKSTLIKIMARNIKPTSGEIFLYNKNINKIKRKDFAKKVAIIHQENSAPSDLKVIDVVLYGRMPHKSLFEVMNEEDNKIANEVMHLTGIYNLKEQQVSDLSGGQRQRVFLAMALAQRTEILFLDEPTTYLDIKYQIEILKIVKKLNKEQNLTIVMILHDINQAIKYSDEIIILKDKQIFAQGKTKDIIQKDIIKDIFNIDVEIIDFLDSKVVLF